MNLIPQQQDAIRRLRDVLAHGREMTGLNDELILAGGAVRDVLMGRSPRDYDFCIIGDYTPALDYDAVRERLLKVVAAENAEQVAVFGSGREIKLEEYATYNSETEARIDYVFKAGLMDFIRYREQPRTGLQQVRLFDACINQCWVDSEGLHATPECLNDIGNGLVTITRNIEQDSAGRVEALRVKFPTHRVITLDMQQPLKWD